ncbi:LamG-like jellyroll fold domain-containing protein [Streptosporangium sp. NPDC002524]|uniref:LamG-like jellyroll fold domain-containing protein n=1 Tax=Streptosporangium sp. NPDC002524 TaxID=3154537 RepID=UPI00332AFDE3
MSKYGGVLAACAGMLLGATLLTVPSAALAEAEPVPVLAYGLDEGTGTVAADASGHGNTGTATRTTTWRDGKYGKAVDLTAGGSRVVANDAPSLRLTSAVTLEAWVNPLAGGNRNVIVGKGPSYRLAATTGIVQTTATTQISGPALPPYTWSHLATTYDGQALRLYVNGALVASAPAQGAIAATTAPFVLSQWGGLVDEVRVYDTALSEAQINADMTTPVTGGALNSPPTALEGLAVVPGHGRAALSWRASTDDAGVTGYQVHRSTAANFTPSASTLRGTVTSTSYADVLPSQGTYHYRVAAIDTSGQLGPMSEAVSAQVLEPDNPPTPPYSVSALGHGGSAAVWWWGATDDRGLSASEVHRSTVSGFTPSATTLVATVPEPSTWEHLDPVPTAGTYYYRIVMVDRIGQRSAPSPQAVATTRPEPGLSQTLALAYGLNEGSGTTVRDASGKGNNGTAYATAWTDGRFGGSVRFLNGEGRISAPPSTSLRMTEGMTVSAWVKPSQESETKQMLFKWKNAESDFKVFASGGGSPGPSVVAFGNTPSQGAGVSSHRTLPVGVWSHLAVTYEANTFVLYVNGEQAAFRRDSFHPAGDAASFDVAGSNLNPFTGEIDEVRAYTAALSPAQIRTVMETPVP